MAKVKVYIGIGHGGQDPGACANGMRETDLALTIGNYCTSYLRAAGVEVCQSRTADIDDDLNDKIRRCNAYYPAVAIDVHINAGAGQGFEVWAAQNSTAGHKLAACIESFVKSHAGQSSRGIKTKAGSSGADYFGWNRLVNAPSLILEAAFIDGEKDAAFLQDKNNLRRMGEAYAKGILQYLGIADNGTTTATDADRATEKEKGCKCMYKTFNDVPAWAQATVKKLMDAGALKGDNNGNINISDDMCRTFVILDRMGKL